MSSLFRYNEYADAVRRVFGDSTVLGRNMDKPVGLNTVAPVIEGFPGAPTRLGYRRSVYGKVQKF